MLYMLLANETDDAFAAREDPERTGEYWTAWSSYIAALNESGILREAAGLLPPAAAPTLRVRDGEHLVDDGPFADTKEHLGGYFVIEVENLDQAMSWARRCPSAAYGSVEIRPVLPMA